MKNKDDISLEIMKRVITYEKKKLRLWYEVVFFVLVSILIAGVWVIIDFVFDIQESGALDLKWIFSEDLETIKILSGSVLNILREELPWEKMETLLLLILVFCSCFVYVLKRKKFKSNKMRQVRAYEKKNN